MTQTTLEWVEFRDHLQDLCHELFEDQRLYSDCVLKTEGKEIYCHRSILSESSDYFKQIFETFPYDSIHPEIIVPEISYNCLQSLICFIYNGEIFIDCKDLNDLWEAATLLDIKSMKIILDGFFTQTQITTLDDTLDALVQDLHETDNATHSVMGKTQATDVIVQDIPRELIDALDIPIVPVLHSNKPVASDVTSPINIDRQPKSEQVIEISVNNADVTLGSFSFEKKKSQGTGDTVEKHHTKTGMVKKRPLQLQSVSMLREKALEYQKELEAAIRECKKGMSLEDACLAYPNISMETLYRNIKNFKLSHIKPLE